MITMDIRHPDILDFIRKKQDTSKITGANISVKLTDDFMEAVEKDEDFILRFPCDINLVKDNRPFEYNKLYPIQNSNIKGYYKVVKAKEIWDELIKCAHSTAEPGIMFEDTHQNYSPDGVYPQYKGVTTNPCFHPDTLIDTIEGKKRIADITEPTYVYSMSKEGNLCIVPCSASFKTKLDAKTLKITLRNGSSIMVTPDHKMYVQDVGWVQAKNLKIKDRIVHILRTRRGKKYIGTKLTTQGNREYVMEHRLVYESVFGYTKDDIHHLDGDTFNNSIDNLEAIPHNNHSRLTALEQNPQTHQERDSNGRFITYSEDKIIQGIINLPSEIATNFKSKWDNSIMSIEEGDQIDVYDIQVPDTNCLIANNMVAHNCGEIYMQPYDSCRLLHHNLTSYVENPFTKDAKFNYKLFIENAYEALILGDNLVDLELEHISDIIHHIQSSSGNNERELDLWKKVANQTKSGRRCGIGITGLTDVIAMLGLSLNSKEALEVIRRIMSTKLDTELLATTDLAILRGTFEGWDPKKEFGETKDEYIAGNSFYKNLILSHSYSSEYLVKYGRRNISWSTVAPTGTVSIIAQVSSGIEPLFLPYYTRRSKCMSSSDKADFIDENGVKFKESMVVHPMFIQWVFTTRKKLSMNTLEQCRHSLENSTSKELDELFKESPWYDSIAPKLDYKQRIEIQSIVQQYTTHSISSTINLPSDVSIETVSDIYFESWKKKLKGNTVYRDGSRSGILVSNKVEIEKDRHAPKRPKSLKADLYISTSGGTKYAIVVGLLKDNPYEVFAFEVGELDIKSCKGVINKVKKRHYEFVSKDYTIENLVLANNKDMEIFCTLATSKDLRHGIPLKFILEDLKKASSYIGAFPNIIARTLSKYEGIIESKCPKCGGRMVNEGGCEKCLDCGESKCNVILNKNITIYDN